jgi:SWI/SNF-related matrix-associated actin-dependent regulator of chromatin subfamily A member 5
VAAAVLTPAHRSAAHGRTEYAAIAGEVDGKTEEDIRRYAGVFWRRVGELQGMLMGG